MSLNDVDRISNLWKKSRGVNDIRKGSSYVNPAQTAFKENIFNDAIFSEEVPDELPGNLVTSAIGTNHPESVEYLDWSFNQVGVNPGQIIGAPGPNTPELGPNYGTRLTSVPHLTYYHRIQLFPNTNADDTKPTGVTKSTWYLPDPSNNKLSLLRDTVNFKTGTRGDYNYKIYSAPQPLLAGGSASVLQEVTDPYSIVFDNKNGLLYLYGDDSASNWKIGSTHEIYISFIRYEGSRGGAGGGGITPGSDVSFNNVDISNNLNIIHNGLETGILQSKTITLNNFSLFSNPRNTVLAEISYSATQNPMTVTGYFTIELIDGDQHTYSKIHLIAGVMTKDGTNLSSGGYDYNCFIKVLNVNRTAWGQMANPGILRASIWRNGATDRVFLAIDHEVQGIHRVNVRLYKNGPNELNVTNELQWTVGKTIILDVTNGDRKLKEIYIAPGPDGGIAPTHPNHPQQPFNATTEFTIIDNSMNIYGDLLVEKDVDIYGEVDISGSLKINSDLSVAGTSTLNDLFFNTSESILTELYSSRVFDNTDFLSDSVTISNGAWQTIAYMPIRYYLDLNVRASYATFEISDRSNRNSSYAFKDTLKFIVNVVESGSKTSSCSLTLLSSNAARNEEALPSSGTSNSQTTSITSNYGYIEKIRVLLGTVNLPISASNPQTIERTGAMVQLYRKSDAPTTTASFNSLTDLRVLMFNNMKILREGSYSNGYAPFVLDNISDASYWRSNTQKYAVDFNLLEESSGHKNVHKGYQGNIIYGYTASAFSKVSSDLIVGEDISGNLIRGNVVRGTNGNMGELDVGTGADDIRVNRKYGGTSSNPSHNTNPTVKSGGTGRESKINSKPDHHGQLTNRAYVQEEVIRVVPSGVSPGIVVANNDWITIAKLGPFDNANTQVVNKGYFRGTALFELQDRSGSHHHNVKFIATFEFNKACLKVIHNSFYSANRFSEIRIKYGGTYQGAVLQFSIDTGHSFSTTGQNLYLKIWQNTNDTGWVCMQDFIQVENTPNIYVPDNIQGGYDNNGNFNSGSGFGTPYPNEEKLSVAINHTNDNNFYERFKSGILVQGGSSSIAMGGGDLELEGGTIIMNSSSSGTGNIEMAQGDIENANDIHGNHFDRSDSTTISIGAANLSNKHFTWFREPIRIYSNTDSITTQYLDDIGFEGACMYNNDDKLELVQINRKLHNGKANFDTVSTTSGNLGDYSGDIKNTEVEVKPFAVTSPFKETILVSLAARNTARSAYRTIKRGTANNYGNGGVIGTDVTAGHLQYQAGYPGFDITSTTQNGQPYVAGLCHAPYDLYIKKIVSRHFSYKCEVNNNTGASRTVNFDVYLAYGPNASNGQHPFQYEYTSATNNGLPDGLFPQSYTCPQNCGVRGDRVPLSVASTNGQYTGPDYSTNHGNFRLARYSRVFATGTTTSVGVRTAVFHTQYTSNSAVENNFKNPTVYNIVDLYGRPIKIPAGSNYGIYLVERRDDNWSSSGTFNSLEFTGYTSRKGSFVSVPITYEIYGEMDMYQAPSPPNIP